MCHRQELKRHCAASTLAIQAVFFVFKIALPFFLVRIKDGAFVGFHFKKIVLTFLLYKQRHPKILSLLCSSVTTLVDYGTRIDDGWNEFFV